MSNKGSPFDDDMLLPAEREAAKFDAEFDWTPVIEDEGEEIDWERETPIVLHYKGDKVLQLASQDDPEVMEDTRLLLFTDTKGENRCGWASFQLDRAFTKENIEPGDVVKVVHLGKAELKQGRTMNRISVYKGTKKAAPSTGEVLPAPETAGV